MPRQQVHEPARSTLLVIYTSLYALHFSLAIHTPEREIEPESSHRKQSLCRKMPSYPVIISECIVYPDRKSSMGDLKLSVSDLPMLSCHYIQKGCLFTLPDLSPILLVGALKCGLSQTLSYFPPLAGRLLTDAAGYVYITCNDAGAGFVHANAGDLHIDDILSPTHVPDSVKGFFAQDGTVSYNGHFEPILTVQLTELADGVFIGSSVNHAVVDGTSLWNFFNTFAEVCRIGVRNVSKLPDFSRNSALISPAVLHVPDGGPKVTFNEAEPLSERVFSFSREQILKLKAKTNDKKLDGNGENNAVELSINGKVTAIILENCFKTTVSKPQESTITGSTRETPQISSFQSLCALLWRAVTRARKLPADKTTTFRMAVNCRHRLEPKLDPYYFGNAIQSIPTYAPAGEVLGHDLRWCAQELNKSVLAHNDTMVRKFVGDWESNPRCFPLGNFDGAMLTMGSSPRFPMYDNDFGWGRPMAVRSGRANKFDGKISAFPGKDGGGSVDLEVVLSPVTMAGIEADIEFMQYVAS